MVMRTTNDAKSRSYVAGVVTALAIEHDTDARRSQILLCKGWGFPSHARSQITEPNCDYRKRNAMIARGRPARPGGAARLSCPLAILDVGRSRLVSGGGSAAPS
jgi:hypothetical protein